MKRILNFNTFLVLIVLFVLFNILSTQFAGITSYFKEKNSYRNLIIIRMDSCYALVRGSKVSIDSNEFIKPYLKDNKVMIPLNFFLESLKDKYTYDDNNNGSVITYKDKKLQLNDNLDIHISTYKNNKEYQYNCEGGEYKEFTAYLPLDVIAGFFDKVVYNRGNIIIISSNNKLGNVDINKLDDMLQIKKPDVTTISIPNVKIDKDLGPYKWIKSGRLVAHALGGIDEQDYTNSLEAFNYNYNAGHKIFEADLTMTRDGKLVARHDWYLDNLIKLDRNIPRSFGFLKTLRVRNTDDGIKMEGIPSEAEFRKIPIRGTYTPLDFVDIIHLMEKHPNVFLVTDTKEKSEMEVKNTFKYIVNQANKIDPKVLDRIIPQIYDEDMLSYINSIHKFPSYIFTLYQLETIDEDEIVKFAKANNIKVITMPKDMYSDSFVEKLAAADIYVYLHTLNDLKEVNFYANNGVYGFYTDYIEPGDLIN